MAHHNGKRLLDLVAGALEVAPENREAWLRDACDGDETLRASARALLSQDESAERLFGDRTAAEPLGRLTEDCHAGARCLPAGMRLGDYSIEEWIGAGGMGVVYRARQLSLNRTVALKTLPRHLRASPRGLERFRREVEAAASLHHPNIVTVFASGDDGETAYYAMEYVEGPSLSRVVDSLRQNPIPAVRESDFDSALLPNSASQAGTPEPPHCSLLPRDDAPPGIGEIGYFSRVARLLAGVAEAAHYAHQKGVIHRDIKPSNLWFSGDGRLRIGDFGLARVASDPGMTQSGEIVGTPYYMAPEQLGTKSGNVDARTDIYAIGATLYELLTLQPPFTGGTREVVLAQIDSDDPRQPRRINRRVPRDLETVCLKALQKHPNDRYQNAVDMADDLLRFADDLPVKARRAGLLHRSVRWCMRRPSLAAALTASLLLAVLAASLAARTQHLADRQSEAASREARVATELHQAEARIAAANETEQQRLFQLAMLYGMQGDASAVESVLREAEELGGSEARLGIARGQVQLFQGAFDTAIAEFEKAAESMPGRIAPRALLAETYARAGVFSTANALRAELGDLTATSVEELILLGRMELQFSPSDALRVLDEAIKRDRRNIVARLIRGSARTQLGYLDTDPIKAERALQDLQLAESLLDETPYLLSQFVNAHLVASAGYSKRGDHATSDHHLSKAEEFTQLLGRYPGDYEAHRWRAYYYERVGDFESAIREWGEIDDKTIGYLIMCLYQEGRFDEALAACDEYRRHTSTGTADFCHSFVLSATTGDVQELVADFRFEDQLRWDPGAGWIGLHTLWNLAGRPQRVIDAMRALSPPQEATSSKKLMYAYVAGKLSSEEYLRRAAQDRRDLALANLLVGVEHLGQGQRAIARERFNDAIAQRMDFEFATAVSRSLLAQLDRDPVWPAWVDGDELVD